MKYKAKIPYGSYWSTPFVKWQGSMQHLHSVKFAAYVAQKELKSRDIDLDKFDYSVLGLTVPQRHSFYATPWFTGLVGLQKVTGPTIMQACASSIRTILVAVQEIESSLATMALAVTADRCSNGPHLYYPVPNAPGGTGKHEDWVIENFSYDPLGRHGMLDTAENCAKRFRITTAEQHEVVLRRYEQYQMSLADNQAFQKRYMSLPFLLPKQNFKEDAGSIMGDEGIIETSAEKLNNLKPLMDNGTVTFGGQTHPADGNAGMVVTTEGIAREISQDSNIIISIMGFGQARCELAYMPMATVPASMMAMEQACLSFSELNAVKSHNPFAVNDIVFSRETGVDLNNMNNFGSSLIWGHPQGPTGMRSLIELIEELVLRGGGFGLFQGCAAGDSSMAIVIQVSD